MNNMIKLIVEIIMDKNYSLNKSKSKIGSDTVFVKRNSKASI